MQFQVVWLGLSIVFSTTIDAYQYYQTFIPNGDKVPNPCPMGGAWLGVGHLVPAGGGDRNPFGLDFAANNHNWTAVCRLDSDHDGRTNGEELGDPNCTWKQGMTSPSSPNITHPGICEPITSTECLSTNSRLQCSPKFNCPTTNSSDVRQLTLRFPQTPVPADETTYICFGFTLPNDTDYHVIATTPIVNNSQVLHHMLLYVCKDEITNYTMFSQPQQCSMAPNCRTLIGVWGVGIGGQCNNDQFGFLIGASGYKYAILQLHWNNPSLVKTFTDSSGMTLYYTPKLRPYSGAVLMVGQLSLDIPPRKSSVSFSGMCSKYCTSALPQPLYIANSLLHMHLLGDSGDIRLYRNGVLNTTLMNVPMYDYNMPPIVQFPAPIKFMPGDEIRVDCTFDSSQKTMATHWGESTQEEMCFGFLAYYPINDNFTQCTQWRSADVCSNVPLNCAIDDFNKLSQMAGSICSSTDCSRTCQILMMALFDTGCMTGDIGLLIAKFSGNPAGMAWLSQKASQCGASATTTTPGLPDTTTSIPLICGFDDFTKLSQFAPLVCNPGSCSHTCQIFMRAVIDTGCMTGDTLLVLEVYANNPARILWLAQMAQQCGLWTSRGQGLVGTTTKRPSSLTSAARSSLVESSLVVTSVTSYLTMLATASLRMMLPALGK